MPHYHCVAIGCQNGSRKSDKLEKFPEMVLPNEYKIGRETDDEITITIIVIIIIVVVVVVVIIIITISSNNNYNNSHNTKSNN
nr:hypothetical protein BaRGS_027934 [Batillaria attramentaria]